MLALKNILSRWPILFVLLGLVTIGLTSSQSRYPVAQAAADNILTLAWSSTDIANSYSIAWGDVDGDGDLDLAVGNGSFTGQPTRLYRNDKGTLTPIAVWSSSDANNVSSLAWGDVDGDGDLDLAVGNHGNGQPNRLYLNDGGVLTPSAVWTSTESDTASSIAWGDVDGDGDLDLAVGNTSQPIRIYRNDEGSLTPSAVWSSTESDGTTSIAWGDVDGDGDLDLAVGNPNRLYRNNGGSLTPSAVWSSTESDYTTSIAWGDVDGDGDLDLAVGNQNQPTRLYRNAGGALTPSAVWSSTEMDETTSLAWGDYDGDGDLDLAVSYFNQPIRLYRNDGGSLTPSAVWSSTVNDLTYSIAWGDVDGDGDLDLAVGNDGPNRLYRNDAGTLSPNAAWSSTEVDYTRSVAWGDVDGDGDLDLAVGIFFQPVRLYRNDGGTLTSSVVWQSTDNDRTTSIAWGDMDGDGDLDLAVGNYRHPIRLYRNDGGVLTSSVVWTSTDGPGSWSIAWGDVDGDGDLDLAAGDDSQPLRLYRNDGGTLTPAAVWTSTDSNLTMSIAWGDVDGDGDLDLAVGNSGQSNRLYRNDGGSLTRSAVWSSSGLNNASSIAWGDVDGDGDLDLAVGNNGQPIRLYRNDGGSLTPSAVWSSFESEFATSIAWGDVDGDGDLDLAVGSSQPNHIYRNDRGTLTPSAVWSSTESDATTSIAWGDVDGDGDLDLAVSNVSQPLRVYRNMRDTQKMPGAVPLVQVAGPGLDANFYSTSRILAAPIIPITYTLKDAQSSPVKQIIAFYSLDGGGNWLPAVPSSSTITTNLPTSPGGTHYVFNWDIFASGFFGKSDNVVFRFQAIPAIANRINSIPGPYMYGAYASSTYPFRVRGTQVMVVNGALPAANAIVYRLPAGSTGRAALITDLTQTPYLTDDQGYLQGRGEILPGDKLVAMVPISTTANTALYYTSAAPNSIGLDMYTVTSGGVQTLTVSAANSLELFNLKVSLEWDARQDTKFLEQLHFDLQRASELLYQWSDGQAALGKVTINHDRLQWADADIRIYASDRRRPAATLGGIVTTDLPDPNVPALVYQPGMVHIGKVWNRYGDPGSSTGEDWPRALAHELGHYALFLDDDYLGLDASGRLISVETCTHTAMADPYRDDYSAFKSSLDWLPGCADTLANKTTGRADWTTITTFYPSLKVPLDILGPSSLPLAVTQVSEVAPSTGPLSLPDPRFYLKDQTGASLQPGSSARAFLIRADRLVDLGNPAVDSVLAPGAQPGDRLCVIDLAGLRLGCKTVQPDDDQQLTLALYSDWQPEVIIAPLDSKHVDVHLGNLVRGLSLSARLYSGDGLVSSDISMAASGADYTGVFTLTEPTSDGFVFLWQNNDSQRVAIADYAMDGNPTRVRSGFTRVRSGFAPAMSSDGQVILYTDSLIFPQNEFYTLQAATSMPAAPIWATPVGHAYWLSKSSGAPDLAGASLSMGYLSQDVPPGEEPWLKVYRWNEVDSTWQALDTQINTTENSASAVIVGPGLYTLMSTIEIPLSGPGWELFSYPVQASRPISDALRSIDSLYNVVYRYDDSLLADPWKVYAPEAPAWVNDLLSLDFGKVYWINLTQSVTLKLKGSSARPAQTSGLAMPPATYYGEVLPGQGFTPAAGQTVTAWIDGQSCGSGQTSLVDGQVVYKIHVAADGPADPGCGALGKTIYFKLGSRLLATTAAWDSDRVWRLDIGVGAHQFLPFIIR